ncbi:MAG: hypothetical protein MMC33_001197 [Icmadophila ericetorum]|nr:hypothetical protein [Icmadophila ericetorum]
MSSDISGTIIEDMTMVETAIPNTTRLNKTIPDTPIPNTTMLDASAVDALISFESDTMNDSKKLDPDLLVVAMGLLQHENADLKATLEILEICAQALDEAQTDTSSAEARQGKSDALTEAWEAYRGGLNDVAHLSPTAEEFCNAACRALKCQRIEVITGIYLVFVNEEIESNIMVTILKNLKDVFSMPLTWVRNAYLTVITRNWWTTRAIPQIIFTLKFVVLALMQCFDFFFIGNWIACIRRNWNTLKQDFPGIPSEVVRYTLLLAFWMFAVIPFISIPGGRELQRMVDYGLAYQEHDVEKSSEKREKD